MTMHRLNAQETAMLTDVFRRRPEITHVVLFGSRAKGTAKPNSDIDLAVGGRTSALQILALAEELDLLPLPYRFDVQSLDNLRNPQLLAHIDRVGVEIYRVPTDQSLSGVKAEKKTAIPDR